MLAALATDVYGNGYLFPLCRSTAFNLTYEEAIKKRHSVGSCWCPVASITEQTSLQTYRCLERKIL